MHLAYYPTAVMQMREMNWPKEFQELLEPLSKMFPFENPEWREWMKNRIDPDLSGDWRVAGYRPGMGYYTGTYRFTPDPKKGKDEYRVNKRVTYTNGKSVTFKGTGTLYSGYHLRYIMTSSASGSRIEGVFDLNSSEMDFTGKWWSVVQDKNTLGNETFHKSAGKLKIIAVFPQSLRAGSGTLQDVRLIGVNFARDLQLSDISFSDPNVFPKQIKKAGSSEIVIAVDVKEKALTGPVKVSVKGVAYKSPVVVYGEIDGIKIFPEIGRARVSCGPAYPPQGVQFVARAVNYGKDGKEGTADDLILEPVNARWWLEEEDTSVSTMMKGLRLAGIYPKFGREKDDDLKYLNTAVNNGLYTPITTYGPIKERVQHTQGTGLIAIGASYKENGNEYKGRSLLAVTVPDFIPQMK
jgi:quinohemoprotein amine dehydrogenase